MKFLNKNVGANGAKSFSEKNGKINATNILANSTQDILLFSKRMLR